MADSDPPALPDSSFLILGVLSRGGERSGYDIHRWAEGLRHLYPMPAHSLVYRELRRLEALDLAASREVAQAARPDKRLYRITGAGRAALRRWVEERPIELPVVRHTVALRLFFGAAADPDRLRALLEDYLAAIDAELGPMAVVEEALSDDPNDRLAERIVRWSYRRLLVERAEAGALLAALAEASV